MNIGQDYFHDKFNIFSSQNDQIKVVKGQIRNKILISLVLTAKKLVNLQ